MTRFAVIGDFMIDEYYQVLANRVSPEFPIPVMKSSNLVPFKTNPGGAGNVCRQIKNFYNDVKFFGILDESSKKVLQNFDINFFNYDFSFCRVPKKKRFYQNDFPLCRIDEEEDNYGLKELSNFQEKIFENLRSENADIIILSDYDKGLFNKLNVDINSFCKDSITIVDPKKGPLSKWKNCTLIKPNSKEAAAISGTNDWKKQCAHFKNETNAKYVVITQEGQGVVGLLNNEFFEYRPNEITEATSVIGAGDCFIASLASAMYERFDIKDCVVQAFKTASLYVKKKYCEPVSHLDLLGSKFVKEPSLLSNRNFSLAFTNGCFDILHLGHLECLKFAKSKADKLVVAVNSDKSVANQKKSHKMVNDFNYRSKMLESLEFVDYVVSFDEDTPYNVIKQINPDVLVKSSEYPNPIGSEIVNRIEIFPIIENISTSKIIEKIKNF